MTDIKKREQKIKDKRKSTNFRQFVKDIGSWQSFLFHRVDWLVTKYPNSDRISKIVSPKEFRNQQDGLLDYGLNYDPSKDFFKTFSSLFRSLPHAALTTSPNSENADYADNVIDCKNAYLSSICIANSSNICYSYIVRNNTNDVFNSIMAGHNSSNIYFCKAVYGSMNVFYSNYIQNCSNIWFSDNLIWCHECILSSWLENQKYCIKNKQLSKEDYFKQKETILSEKEKYIEFHKNISHQGLNIGSKDVQWNFITRSQDINNGYIVSGIKNWNNIIFGGGQWDESNIYDGIDCVTWMKEHDYYGVLWCGSWSTNLYCSIFIEHSHSIYYSYNLYQCSCCVWCVWLQNKQFCIFNKQYTKEERFQKVDEIFAQMDQEWILWEFFPWSINPFYFNDTASYLIDNSFTKEEVEAEWYLWRDEEIKVDIPEWLETVKTSELNNYQWFDAEWNRKINPEILKKVIVDEQWNSYRIIKMEYEFLMKYGLPLPEQHRLDRIKMWFKFK